MMALKQDQIPLRQTRPIAIVTTESVARYATCARAWWLSEIQGLAHGEEWIEAQIIIARRRRLSQALRGLGFLLILAAILIVILGSLLS
jgi:hypothetical protein